MSAATETYRNLERLRPTAFVVIHELADLVAVYGTKPSKNYALANHGHFAQGVIDGMKESLVVNGLKEQEMTVGIKAKNILDRKLRRAQEKVQIVKTSRQTELLKGKINGLKWVLGEGSRPLR